MLLMSANSRERLQQDLSTAAKGTHKPSLHKLCTLQSENRLGMVDEESSHLTQLPGKGTVSLDFIAEAGNLGQPASVPGKVIRKTDI